MISVQFPEPVFRIRHEGDKKFIFDGIRKQWLLLTEEEWVRQNFVQYLTEVLHYPTAFIALEKQIRLNELKKRFDILVYDTAHQPWMMVECKEPEVNLSELVLQQLLRYNISVPVIYMVITNGHHTIGWKKENEQLTLLKEMPAFGK